jgi:DNA-binding transcriptional ArsR family regulator
MSTLLEKPISVNRILVTSIDHAKAIEDPARAKIVQMLYNKNLNAEQITSQLKKVGHKKALTTIRHHLDILKESGLIEIVKIEERRGAITKFYGTSTKLLDYETPKDFDQKYSSLIKSTSSKLQKIVNTMSKKTGKTIKSNTKHEFNQYLMMEIVNRAMTNVLEGKS